MQKKERGYSTMNDIKLTDINLVPDTVNTHPTISVPGRFSSTAVITQARRDSVTI